MVSSAMNNSTILTVTGIEVLCGVREQGTAMVVPQAWEMV